MTEVLVEFTTAVTGPDGAPYTPRVCGRPNANIWEGWIEFVPLQAGGEPVRTGVESEQPNRADLLYWAEGLTQVFLDGALARALRTPVHVERTVTRRPIFDGPASQSAPGRPAEPLPRAVLDPFETYLQGGEILHDQLHALDTQRLRDIAIAYGLADRARADEAGRGELETIIMNGVTSGTAADPSRRQNRSDSSSRTT